MILDKEEIKKKNYKLTLKVNHVMDFNKKSNYVWLIFR
jgi:hypothetical protein